MLDRANHAFSAVNQANTNDTLQATDTKAAPLLPAYNNSTYYTAKLFARMKDLHDHQAQLNLNPEQAERLDVKYKQFQHAGAELAPAKQTQLKAMNKRLSTLQTDFSQKLLAAAKAGALHVTDKAALAGLSDQQVAAAEQAAKDRKLTGYVIPLQNTTQQPMLESLSNHATRQALFEASLNRAEKGNANDTRAVIREIAKLRAEKAGLFGYTNWTDYTLYAQMAKNRETALELLTWSPDMRAFQVYDQDGKELALFMIDPWKRDNKAGGAWMSNLVNQSYLRGTKPVIYNVENFTKPAPGQPALISFDDVTTMFHEFGHALHGMFASQTYPTLSGTAVARDFVEFPSQFNENWALDPKILPHYAVHYQTGQTIPPELVQKIMAARTFNQGYEVGEVLEAARLDLDWHSLPATAPLQDVDRFEADALAKSGFDTADVPSRYRSSYFLHIWSNGYSAGYYAYPWTRMLGQDAFSWFQANGGLTRANGQRFRDMVLSRGNTMDYAEMYRATGPCRGKIGRAQVLTPVT